VELIRARGRLSDIPAKEGAFVMNVPIAAPELLDHEFLEIRAKLLQVAAALDRLDRAQGDVSSDKRRINIDKALRVLTDRGADRAERLQMLFSLPYDENWKTTLSLNNGRTG
jgi:hypothetical protein